MRDAGGRSTARFCFQIILLNAKAVPIHLEVLLCPQSLESLFVGRQRSLVHFHKDSVLKWKIIG